ncbi:hypothetical protein [Anaerovorax odorimutans]|uniref:hypothetical protein n=1 Tax=Anaerovorax odorimutans TaxID=109327 RepID=UPI0004842B88|nr:hypothetical protein [Anaerovorax odorimutans]
MMCKDLPKPCDEINKNTVKEKNINITLDNEGNAFVNGNKMHREDLNNGIKVFLFKDSELE